MCVCVCLLSWPDQGQEQDRWQLWGAVLAEVSIKNEGRSPDSEIHLLERGLSCFSGFLLTELLANVACQMKWLLWSGAAAKGLPRGPSSGKSCFINNNGEQHQTAKRQFLNSNCWQIIQEGVEIGFGALGLGLMSIFICN